MLMSDVWTGPTLEEDGPPMTSSDWADLAEGYWWFMREEPVPATWKPIASENDLHNFMWLCQDRHRLGICPSLQWGNA